jgi:hypothetical protein
VRTPVDDQLFQRCGRVEPGAVGSGCGVLGVRGFFHDYDARMDEPLKAGTGRAWAEGFAALLDGRLDGNAICRAVAEGEPSNGTLSEAEFAAQLPAPVRSRAGNSQAAMTRKAAIQLLFRLLP